MKSFFFFLLLLFSFSLLAKVTEHKSLKKVVDSFNSLQNEVNRLHLQGANCENVQTVSATDQCSLEAICTNINNRPLSVALYQDKKGRAINNNQLHSFFSTIRKCLNRNPSMKKMIQKKGESPFWEMSESLNNNIFYSYKHFKQKVVGEKVYQQNIAALNTRLKEVDAIFEATKLEVIEFLNQQNSPANPTIKRYIEKVKQLEFYNNPFCDLEEGKVEFNAYYQPWSHSIRICLPMLNSPDLDVKKFILHEIGHTFDPLTENLELNESKIKIVHKDEEELAKDLIKPNFKREKYLGVNIELRNKKMSKAYPFAKVIHCLGDEQRLGEYDGSSENSGENFSDWLATTLLSENNIGDVNKQDLMLLIPGSLIPIYCTNLSDQALNELDRFMKVANCGALPRNLTVSYGTFLGDLKPASMPHASGKSRIDKVFFSHPKLREKLGCNKSASPDYCGVDGVQP